jgi:hypothetical protein
MRVLLNAGFGSLLGVPTLQEIQRLGFTGVRQDILDPGAAGALVSETIAASMPSLFIVRSEQQAVAAARAIRLWPSEGLEIGNEEDSKQTPKAYHRQLVSLASAIRAVNPSVRIWSAGITTLDTKRLEWLETVYALGVPSDVGVAVHTYRQETGPSVPVEGSASRAEEFEKVRRFAGTIRPLAVSEVGWHTAPFKVKKGWFGSSTRMWTDEQVAGHLQGELTVAKVAGAEFCTIFQLNDNDGPNTSANYEGRFGIRRQDGTWKPQAEAVGAWVRLNK